MPESKILIVDDNLALRSVYEEIFRQERYHVTTADDGIGAYKHFMRMCRNGGAPDVVLTDIQMSPMNGAELAAFMLKNGVPTVLMTGHPTLLEYLPKIFPGVPIIEKPCNMELLVETIERAHTCRLVGEQVQSLETIAQYL